MKFLECMLTIKILVTICDAPIRQTFLVHSLGEVANLHLQGKRSGDEIMRL